MRSRIQYSPRKEGKKFIVLETYDIINQLVMLMEFVVDNNPGTGLKKLTKTGAMDLLHKMTIQAVNWRLAHNPYGNYENQVMASLFGERDKAYTKKEKAVHDALTNDPQWTTIIGRLESQIDYFIEVNTYKDWRVVKVGNVIGMAEGEDYRITEYHKLNPDQRENEEAVVTLDASNPLNYLLGQFNHTFGKKLTDLLNQQPHYFAQQYQLNQTLITHENKLTEMRLQAIQRHGWEMVKTDPEAIQRHLRWVFDNTHTYVTSMFLDALATMYPQIELEPMAPRFNSMGMAQLGVWNMEKFKEDFIQRIVAVFGFSYLSTYLKKDKRYTLEYYPSSNVVAIYEKQMQDSTLAEKHELVQSYIRGDRLPPHEAKQAQELYEEMNRAGAIQ